MEESALNRAAGPGSGAPHVGAEWGRGREGGARSQRRGSETGLIGRGWSCGGRKGGGDYLRVGGPQGRGSQEGVLPGAGMGVQEPRAWGGGGVQTH